MNHSRKTGNKSITPVPLSTLRFLLGLFILLFTVPSFGFAKIDNNGLRSLYLPISSTTERRLKQLIHYGKQSGFNAFVIHVKDPKGRVFWKSNNKIAKEIGAISTYYDIPAALKLLKKENIYTIAKIDIFADHLLAKHHPEMAVSDIDYGEPWYDKNFLFWANAFDKRAQQYNIDLMKELVGLGFDEIQLDYVRFPSDGAVEDVYYPIIPDNTNKIDAIEGFLKDVNTQLKPLGTTISADLFGITVWRKNDFNIGQVLEKMAPHLDVICPMLYPSHFPKGFNGWKNPNAVPEAIMFQSMQQVKKRGNWSMRPWLQGFWYKPDQIIDQIRAMERSGTKNWAVWNASGNYGTTFDAIAKRDNITYTPPSYYPTLDMLASAKSKVVSGKISVVNKTDYQKQYTVLTLEKSKKGYRSPYRYIIQIVRTLDEAVMDHILSTRGIKTPEYLTKTRKELILSKWIIKDLNINPRRVKPKPIYIHWGGDCQFSYAPPKNI